MFIVVPRICLLYSIYTGYRDSLQDLSWRQLKQQLLDMLETLHQVQTSVHVLMVFNLLDLSCICLVFSFVLSSSLYWYLLFILDWNFTPGIICVGGDGIVNEVSFSLLSDFVINPVDKDFSFTFSQVFPPESCAYYDYTFWC